MLARKRGDVFAEREQKPVMMGTGSVGQDTETWKRRNVRIAKNNHRSKLKGTATGGKSKVKTSGNPARGG